MAGTSRDAQMESSASSDDSDSDTDTLLPFFGDGGEARSFTVSKTGWRHQRLRGQVEDHPGGSCGGRWLGYPLDAVICY